MHTHTYTDTLQGQKKFQETRHVPAFGRCTTDLKGQSKIVKSISINVLIHTLKISLYIL